MHYLDLKDWKRIDGRLKCPQCINHKDAGDNYSDFYDCKNTATTFQDGKRITVQCDCYSIEHGSRVEDDKIRSEYISNLLNKNEVIK